MLKVAGVVLKVEDHFKPTWTLQDVLPVVVGPKPLDEAEGKGVIVFVGPVCGLLEWRLCRSKCNLQVIGLDDVTGRHFYNRTRPYSSGQGCVCVECARRYEDVGMGTVVEPDGAGIAKD